MPTVGNAILAPLVSTYPEYQGKTITPLILGEAAMSQKNRLTGDGVDLEQSALSSLQQLSAGNGNMTATLILIYNATGGDLNYVAGQDWSGHQTQQGFDGLIQNGQWSYALHTHAGGTWAGSVGCCIYRGEEADFFLGWSDPYGGSTAGNGVHVQSGPQGHWPAVVDWDSMYNLVNDAGAACTNVTPPFKSQAWIGAGPTPVCHFLLQRTA